MSSNFKLVLAFHIPIVVWCVYLVVSVIKDMFDISFVEKKQRIDAFNLALLENWLEITATIIFYCAAWFSVT